MPPDRDDESGRFSEEYDRSEFLTAVEAIDNATTSKIAESVGCSYDLAYRRLKELRRDGEIRGEKVGNSFLWYSVE